MKNFICISSFNDDLSWFKEFDYPHIEEVFSDIVDRNFEYGGTTNSYPSEPKTFWQEEIRTKKRTIFSKGDPLTEHEYSNHSERIREKFAYMIENNGEIPEHLKTKNFNFQKFLS